MSGVEVRALRLACQHVEDFRLVVLASTVRCGRPLSEAAEAVQTQTVSGCSGPSGTVWANPRGLRVWPAGPATREVPVTWTQVAQVLAPVLRGDLGDQLEAAHRDRARFWRRDEPPPPEVERRWRRVRNLVVHAAFTTISVQPSLFDTPAGPASRPGRQLGRGR